MARLSEAERARLSNYELIEEERRNPVLVVRNAFLKYKNFAGDPEKNYNKKDPARKFCLIIDEPVAIDLISRGWNVRKRDPNNEGDEPYYLTEVTVNLDSLYPPTLQLFTELNGQYNEPIKIDPEDFIKIDRGEIRIKTVDVAISLAKGGGRYLQELSIYERPQRTGWLEGDYARHNAYQQADQDDEMPFDED